MLWLSWFCNPDLSSPLDAECTKDSSPQKDAHNNIIIH